jgi:hypothetical protein
MWLPRKNRWTLIDFGCAARTGEKARQGFSVSYAAPEVIQAVRAGQQEFEVTEGLDVWSVGILALEMFTGQPVYSSMQSKKTVCLLLLVAEAMLCSHAVLEDVLFSRAVHPEPAQAATSSALFRCHVSPGWCMAVILEPRFL